MRIGGIDPGNNGAICVIDTANLTQPALLDLANTSIYDITKWLHWHNVDVFWIEDVHSLYGMSAKSNFGFGKSVGIVTAIAVIAGRGAEPKLVAPKIWQKYVGVVAKGKAIKCEVAKLATHHYPQADLYGKLGGLKDGRADALMIAHYGINHTP